MKFNIKSIILGIIISVVFLMFAVYGTKLSYKEPNYDKYCNKSIIPRTIENKTQISEDYQSCYGKYNKARENYSKNLFIISLIASLVVIIISSLFIQVENVSAGLMLGSLFFIIYGTGNYWRYMEDVVRFLILGGVLSVLIYLGYKLK